MKEKNNTSEKSSFEAKQNLTGFFRLLLEIDMRNNPQLYKAINYTEGINDENKSR